MSDEPEATEEEETAEGEAVAPPLESGPILGDQRTDVATVGSEGTINLPPPATQAEAEVEGEPTYETEAEA